MKAAIMVQQNQPLVIDDIEFVDSLAIGQVLIEVKYATICGSQIGEIVGIKGPDPYLPHLMGHEGSGIVKEVGPGVTKVKPGDHVVLQAIDGSGIPASPATYKWLGNPLNAGRVATFCEYAVCAESRVTRIPKNFDLALAPLLGCAVLTGAGAVENLMQPKLGESVIVYGCGGVGLSVIRACFLHGMSPIVGVDINPAKLDLARAFGATYCYSTDASNLDYRFDYQPFDYAVVCTESTEPLQDAYYAVGEQGKVLYLGLPKRGDQVSIKSMDLHNGKTVTGARIGKSYPCCDIPRFVKMADQLKLEQMITEAVALEDINEGINRMQGGEVVGRCLVKMKEIKETSLENR